MSIESFESYLRLEKNYSEHTVTAYITDVKSFFTFIGEGVVFSEINYAVIRSWIIELVESGMANQSVNRKISSIKSYNKFLMRIGVQKEDFFVNHRSLKVSEQVQVPFSEEEVCKVLSYIKEVEGGSFEDVRDVLLVELLYGTGVRRAELLNIKVTDVDFELGQLRILGKRGKERFLPLLPTVSRLLALYLDVREKYNMLNSRYLFLTSKGKKLYPSFVYRLINMYFSNTSDKVKVSPHIVRHSFATHLLNSGASINTVKELLGHSSLASTQVYTHNSLNELKKVYMRSHPRNGLLTE